MTIDLTCQKCEGSFELEVSALIDGAEKLACPNCQAKVPADLADDFTSALADLVTQVGNLSKRFLVSLTIESDELPEEEDEEEEDDEGGEDDDEEDDDEDDEPADDEDFSDSEDA
jgi:hypothetical protein